MGPEDLQKKTASELRPFTPKEKQRKPSRAEVVMPRWDTQLATGIGYTLRDGEQNHHPGEGGMPYHWRAGRGESERAPGEDKVRDGEGRDRSVRQPERADGRPKVGAGAQA